MSAGANALSAAKAPRARTSPPIAPERAEHRRFGEELSHDVRPTGADREANRELAPPAGGTQQRHDRHVDARDEEHERRGALQDAEREPHVSEQAFAERHDAQAPRRLAVGVGQIAAELAGDALQIVRGGRGGDAGAEPRHGEEVAVVAVGPVPRPEIERHPRRDLRLGVGQLRGDDADDRILDAVQPNGPGEHIFRAAEVRSPQCCADDGGARAPDVVVVAVEQHAAARRADAEHGEEVRGDVRGLDPLGHALAVAGGSQRHASEVRGGDTGERSCALAHVADFGARQAAVGAGDVGAHMANADETTGVGIRQLGKHDAVEHAEERGVRAHAQRQGHDRDGGEAGRLREGSKSESQVAHASGVYPLK